MMTKRLPLLFGITYTVYKIVYHLAGEAEDDVMKMWPKRGNINHKPTNNIKFP